METLELLKMIVETADEYKAMDLEILDVREVCSFADYFVIMCGNPPISLEGLPAAEWCLLDYGDIVVHIFLPAKREYYQLEELWSEATRVDAGDLTAAP